MALLAQLYSAKVNWANGRRSWQFSLPVFRGAGVLQEPQDRGTGQVGLQHGLFWEIASRYCCWMPEAQRELCSGRATGDMLRLVAWEKQSSARMGCDAMRRRRRLRALIDHVSRRKHDLLQIFRTKEDSIGAVVRCWAGAYPSSRRALTGPLNAGPESLRAHLWAVSTREMGRLVQARTAATTPRPSCRTMSAMFLGIEHELRH